MCGMYELSIVQTSLRALVGWLITSYQSPFFFASVLLHSYPFASMHVKTQTLLIESL
jgi:hypothetical protein